jgi:hypothetical protein
MPSTDSDIAIALSLEEQAVLLRQIEALESCPAWTNLVKPWIARTAREEAAAHEDEGSTAEKRAEHLHSMKLFRKLSELVENERARITAFQERHK